MSRWNISDDTWFNYMWTKDLVIILIIVHDYNLFFRNKKE